MKISKIILVTLLTIASITVIGAGLELIGVEWFKFIAPRKAAAERYVFEETRSYNQAKQQELSKYEYEYRKAEKNKETGMMKLIASTVRHRFADYDDNRLPTHLRDFLREVRQ